MERLWSIVLVLFGAGIALAETGPGETPVQPREVSAAYLAAIQARDLDAAGALFTRDSTIFETGGEEGTWQHYRDHHLGPELDAIKTFEFFDTQTEIEMLGKHVALGSEAHC